MNPLDGHGCQDVNVTAYRFALIECDQIPRPLQLSLLARLPLPIAAILTSGGRSLHAWVKVNAAAHVENRESAGIRTGDWLETFDAVELALKWPVMVERGAMNDLQRHVRASHVARQPNFAISPAPDETQQLVIGNGQLHTRDLRCCLLRHQSAH
jgi:hypothetical protein